MNIETKINLILSKHPKIKKQCKYLYQKFRVMTSKKFISEGNITRVSPNDEYEYFFGYYDKSPWDISGRYMLCLKARDASKEVAPNEPAEILLIDTKNNNEIKVIAETCTWNVQQGCMMQWLGPNFDSEIIFNDFRNNEYCSVILNVFTGEERIINKPVYSVSNDGEFALTLDFSRLHRLRPGYGYSNIEDKTKEQDVPDDYCIWYVDLKNNNSKGLLKYNDFYDFEHREEMNNAEHKVNHIMLNPNGNRFMVIHRWLKNGKKYSRLVTCNIDGTEMYNLSDDDMVSHCFWKDDNTILAFENKKETGVGYYLMKDKTKEYEHKWDNISNDGHPSYSPDRRFVVTDSYPNGKRIATIRLLTDSVQQVIGKVFCPFRYDNDTRCDLHPRWSRDGKKICFDGTFEGRRRLYQVKIEDKKDRHTVLFDESYDDVNVIKDMVSCIIPTYKRCDTLKRAIESVINQTYKNIEVIIVDDNEFNNEYSKEVQKIISEFAMNPKVRYVQQKIHKNGAVARNIGIKIARGEYIAFLDDDDEWTLDKIEKQIRILKDNKDIDVVTCLWTSYTNGREGNKCKIYETNDVQFKILLREISICTPTIIIKKECIKKFGGFDEKLLRHQDLQFLIDAANFSEFKLLPEYLVKINTDSKINRPNTEAIINVKKDFFESINDTFEKYNSKEKNRIKNAHYFEIIFVALKEKKIMVAIKYFFKIGFNTKSFRDVYRRYRLRK